MRQPFSVATIATVLLLGIFCVNSRAYAADATVTVMTQNMDAGTDLKLALAYLSTSTPALGIDLTYQEILQSNIPGRAAILAQEIAAAKPQIVSLQEVTVWETGSDVEHLTPLFDQLQLLLGALTALGEDYSVVDVNPLTQIALPMSNGDLLGFLDRDVVLVRNNAGLGISNVRNGRYALKLTIPAPLGNIDVPRGWIAADVTSGGNTFTFVDTHLESTYPGEPQINLLQAGQAQELATLFAGTDRVVIAGDFNSNATHTPPEQTPSVQAMLTSGLTDSWPTVNHGIPGFTWPLYVEDPLAAHPQGPFERIDFIFERSFAVQSVDRIGLKRPQPSDHAGVVAILAF
jgi:endonuclease/exonuclease/phosphatase family metal-dependent hydrolase